MSRDWIRSTVMGMRKEDIEKVKEQQVNDKVQDLELEATTLPGEEGGGEEPAGGGDEAGGGGGLFGGDEKGGALLTAEPGSGNNSPIGEVDEIDDDEVEKLSIDDDEAPGNRMFFFSC